MMCPNCHSTHVQKNNYARKAGATIGFTAGGAAGWGGASVGAQAGAAIGLVAGPVGAVAGGRPSSR